MSKPLTLALMAGVPLELVQKVTGHKTTDIVLKHYFQPGREAFRQALQAAMPKLMMSGQGGDDGRSKMGDGGVAKRDDAMRAGEVSGVISRAREIVAGMKAKTWKADQAQLLELLKAG